MYYGEEAHSTRGYFREFLLGRVWHLNCWKGFTLKFGSQGCTCLEAQKKQAQHGKLSVCLEHVSTATEKFQSKFQM